MSLFKEFKGALVAEMENHRSDLCVILAGYKDEMYEFLKTNSGLESRIPHIVEFPNYSKDELIEIFLYMVKKNSIDYRSRNVSDIAVLQGLIKEQNELNKIHVTL